MPNATMATPQLAAAHAIARPWWRTERVHPLRDRCEQRANRWRCVQEPEHRRAPRIPTRSAGRAPSACRRTSRSCRPGRSRAGHGGCRVAKTCERRSKIHALRVGCGRYRVHQGQRNRCDENVTTSTPYVTGSPTVAMRRPASGGPSTRPRLPRSDSSAAAALSCRGGRCAGRARQATGAPGRRRLPQGSHARREPRAADAAVRH